MSTHRIMSARNAEFALNSAFRALLTEASDATGQKLETLIQEISDMKLLIIPDQETNPVALAVYRRVNAYAVEIEYLAVTPQLRRQGAGIALIQRVQELESAMVIARTDADAIDFYRATGFQCNSSVSDPRWPQRSRYFCVLPFLPFVRDPESDDAAVEWVQKTPVRSAITFVESQDSWSDDFAFLKSRIMRALGPQAISVEHVGSTSVPGLPAKPVIDIVLTVADPARESAYVEALEAAGFALRLREPQWYEHRLLVAGTSGVLPEVNMHVFAPGSPETSRMLSFRDWLLSHPADKAHYARVKRTAAAAINEQGGGLVMEYNALKEPLIQDLYTKIYAT